MFEVGNPDLRGMKAAKTDGSVYRTDIRGIDCADARLIAAAPELLDACKAVLDALIRQTSREGCILWLDPPHVLDGVHESAIERLRKVISMV